MNAPELDRQIADLTDLISAHVLGAYGLPADSAVDLLSVSENATFRIVPPGGSALVLRAHRAGYVTRENIESEIAWTAGMRAATGVRTPAVIPTVGNENMVTLRDTPLADERNFVMFEFAPGAEAAVDDIGRWAPALGEIAGEIHAFSATWTPPSWFSRHRWTAETVAGRRPRWGAWRNGIPGSMEGLEVLERAVRRARGIVDDYGEGADRAGLVHADLRLANLLVDGDGSLTVIDFDDCGHGWHLWDLASVFRTMEDHPELGQIAELWLSGYRRIRPIPPRAEEILPSLLILTRFQGLGWIGTHRDTELVRSMATEYIAGTLELAEKYLSTGTWW